MSVRNDTQWLWLKETVCQYRPHNETIECKWEKKSGFCCCCCCLFFRCMLYMSLSVWNAEDGNEIKTLHSTQLQKKILSLGSNEAEAYEMSFLRHIKYVHHRAHTHTYQWFYSALTATNRTGANKNMLTAPPQRHTHTHAHIGTRVAQIHGHKVRNQERVKADDWIRWARWLPNHNTDAEMV